MTAAIVGCGYVGTRIAALLHKAGISPQCWVHSAASAQVLRESGFDVCRFNLDDTSCSPDFGDSVGDGVGDSLGASSIATLFYLVPPQPHGIIDTRSRAMLARLSSLLQPENKIKQLKQIVLISTTGVYGDCKGDWVDENRPLSPSADRSRRRVDAENCWQRFCASEKIPLVILRVAGIYANDKLPVQRLKQQTPVLAQTDSPFSNRIHAADLANICVVAGNSQRTDIFNVADDEPTTMTDYFFRVAAALGLPEPPEISYEEATATFSAGMLSYLNESRKIDNNKLKTQLGIQLRYPTLADGLQEI